MKTKHRRHVRMSLELIKGSLSVLIPFEIFYKLLALYVVMPIGSWIVSTTLKITGINYVTTENVLGALLNPLVFISVFIVLILFTAYTIFEISFLTLTFNQSYQKKQLSLFRMIGISLSDAIRVIRPKNYVLVLLVMLVIPISDSLMVSSLIGSVEIPNYIIEVITAIPLYVVGISLLLVIFVAILIRYIFVFHVYTLEDKSVKNAAKEAVAIAHGERIRSLLVFLVWQLSIYLILTILAAVISMGLALLSANFAENPSVYATLLTLNMSVQKVISFLIPTIMVISGYAMISSIFFRIRQDSDRGLPQALEPKTVDNGKQNLKICIFSASSCLLVVVGFAYYSAHRTDIGTADKMLVMAHRGDALELPENTLPAFSRAIDVGADYIELDVQETKDGEILVTHDSNFLRCTGVNANVWETTLAEAKKLDASMRYHRELGKIELPTLAEAMELCKGKIRINIELKSNGHEKQLEKGVAELITKYDMDDEVVVTSLTKKCLVNFKKEKPEIKVGYIVSIVVGDYVDIEWADFFSVEQSFVTKNLIAAAHAKGKTIHAWTIESTEEVEKMLAIGADSVITANSIMARTSIVAFENPLSRLIYSIDNG